MIYHGTRDSSGRVEVCVDGAPLPPRNDLANHSPDGFEWGYGGSGPTQLGLAILAHHLRDDTAALERYKNFTSAFVAQLPREEPWSVTSQEIDGLLGRLGLLPIPRPAPAPDWARLLERAAERLGLVGKTLTERGDADLALLIRTALDDLAQGLGGILGGDFAELMAAVGEKDKEKEKETPP